MARKFIFENSKITEINEAYLKDMPKLYDLYKKDFDGSKLYKLTGDETKHIHVLRYKILEGIVINNMECKILHISKDYIIICKIKDVILNGQPNIKLSIYPAFLKGEKMDFLIQKSTELGVTDVSAFFSKHTIVKLDYKAREKRKDKLIKIATEAVKQCGRTDEVRIHNFLEFEEVLKEILNHDFCILAYEKEEKKLKDVIFKLKSDNNNQYNNIAIIIGPEGGFSLDEVHKLNKIPNLHTVSLGERILRAETASINLISILMYEFGNN